MGKRAPDYRRFKKDRSYTVEQAAQLCGCHRNTVRNWQRLGLEPIDDKRPIVFDGSALREFHEARRSKRKSRLKPGEIYCLPCRAPKEPAGDMAEYVPLTEVRGNLRGICPTCDRLIHRAVSRDKIEAVRGKLEVTFTEPKPRITDCGSPSVSCDFKAIGDA
jgi:hypothetical protein